MTRRVKEASQRHQLWRISATPRIAIMALAKKSYPKATLKKIIKAHSNHNLKKNADVTVRSKPRRVAQLPELTVQ